MGGGVEVECAKGGLKPGAGICCVCPKTFPSLQAVSSIMSPQCLSRGNMFLFTRRAWVVLVERWGIAYAVEKR